MNCPSPHCPDTFREYLRNMFSETPGLENPHSLLYSYDSLLLLSFCLGPKLESSNDLTINDLAINDLTV
jgi:hypothetical protein